MASISVILPCLMTNVPTRSNRPYGATTIPTEPLTRTGRATWVPPMNCLAMACAPRTSPDALAATALWFSRNTTFGSSTESSASKLQHARRSEMPPLLLAGREDRRRLPSLLPVSGDGHGSRVAWLRLAYFSPCNLRILSHSLVRRNQHFPFAVVYATVSSVC